jgi:hypothetical protein
MPVLTECAGARIADYGLNQMQFLLISVQDFTALGVTPNAHENSCPKDYV